jgi:hypothetical protein
MQKLLLLICICGFCFTCASIPKKAYKRSLCLNNWKYFTLTDSLQGSVIEHQPAGPCGIFAFNASTIIRTASNDTIRVLELCNNRKLFVKGDSVIVKPANPYGAIVFVSQFDCKIVKTCYGVVTKVN